MSNKIHNLILEEWISSLISRDRTKNSVSSNFEDLFESLHKAGASFDEAHGLLARATKAHYPKPGVARNYFKNLKKTSYLANKTEKDFIDDWHKGIDDKATAAFFSIYPLKPLDDDGEPKVFGQMSAKEYRAQRRHADSFPTLDTTELEKRMNERQYNLDIEDLVKHVLGDEDEQ